MVALCLGAFAVVAGGCGLDRGDESRGLRFSDPSPDASGGAGTSGVSGHGASSSYGYDEAPAPRLPFFGPAVAVGATRAVDVESCRSEEWGEVVCTRVEGAAVDLVPAGVFEVVAPPPSLVLRAIGPGDARLTVILPDGLQDSIRVRAIASCNGEAELAVRVFEHEVVLHLFANREGDCEARGGATP